MGVGVHALSRELTAPGHHVDLMNSAFHNLGSSVLRQHRLDTGSPRLLVLSSGMLEAKSQEPSGASYNYGVAIPTTPIAEPRCPKALSCRLRVHTGKPGPELLTQGKCQDGPTSFPACGCTPCFSKDSTGHGEPYPDGSSKDGWRGDSPGPLQSQQVCFYLIFMVHGGIFVKKDCPIPP